VGVEVGISEREERYVGEWVRARVSRVAVTPPEGTMSEKENSENVEE